MNWKSNFPIQHPASLPEQDLVAAPHHQQEATNLELQRVQGDLLLAQTSVTLFVTKLGSLDAVRSLCLHLKRLQAKPPSCVIKQMRNIDSSRTAILYSALNVSGRLPLANLSTRCRGVESSSNSTVVGVTLGSGHGKRLLFHIRPLGSQNWKLSVGLLLSLLLARSQPEGNEKVKCPSAHYHSLLSLSFNLYP